jgi:hypothetical protein
MPNFARVVLTGAFVAIAASFGAADLAAQTVPAADAQPFLGEWAVAINAEGQTFVMDVSITDAQGSLAAEVGSDMGGTSKVETITKTGENLVLSYNFDAQGQSVPVVLTLAPSPEGLNANIDFADGMYETTGKGTRK